MRTHRGKQYDWTKAFILIDSKKNFDDLDTENELVISFNSKPDSESAPITKKQQIIVPKIQTVKRITEVKSFATVNSNYHRLSFDLNLPKLINYQLNEVDHVFLQGHSHRFNFEGKTILTEQFLSKAFIQLQLKAGKDPVLPRTKSWMMNFLQRQYPHLSSWPQLQQFAQLFYNYWKNRREELKFPLVRSLWRPNPDQYNHLLAFKPREKEKRNLRRTNRLAEDQIANQMEEEFSLTMKIAERIKAREQIKCKQVQVQLQNFHNQYKNIFEKPDFFEEVNMENRGRDKQKLKRLQQEVEQVKKLQIEEQMQCENENQENQTYDQKMSIVQFVSTILFHSEQFGISYEKIFHEKGPARVSPPIPSPVQENFVREREREEPVQVQKTQPLHLKVYKEQNTVYRLLDEDDENEYYDKIPTTYFDYLRQQIKGYYFGDDDEGDFKDLRKNVSQSFRKFQQLNKMISESI